MEACPWASGVRTLKYGLRSETLGWSFLRTGVRLPPPPPDYLPSFDKKDFLSVGGFILPKRLETKGFQRFWVR